MSAAEVPSGDLFPSTERTWIVDRIRAGDRDDLHRHLMTSYSGALAGYVSATGFRTLSEPGDLVSGFFASRLSQDGWLSAWLESGMRLRRWLMNGLLLYCHERVAERGRDGRTALLPADELDVLGSAEDAVRTFERVWARGVIEQATLRARQLCEEGGQARHWELFLRHHVGQRPYAELAPEFGVTEQQAAGMVRTASIKLRRALLEVLVRDGAEERDLDAEIAALLDAMRGG
jgi:DNA-directed RNA polymerase specialized sigma24 family protein